MVASCGSAAYSAGTSQPLTEDTAGNFCATFGGGPYVIFNGALGTPSSGTLTNAAGLPISTGVTGLGTNVSSALGNTLNGANGLVGYNGNIGPSPSGGLSNLVGILLPSVVGDSTTAPHESTTVALAGVPTNVYTNGLWRDDYASGNGASPLFYEPSNSACSLNAGAGDGGSQVPSSDGKCWIAKFPASGADVREWGAICNGNNANATADTTAVNNAVNAVHGKVIVPASSVCVVSVVILTSNITLEGAGPGATIRRMNTDTTWPVALVADGTANVVIRNLIIDGNKANNATCGTDLTFDSSAYNFLVEHVYLENAKANGGCGNGIKVENTLDEANGTHSRLIDVHGLNNDSATIYADGQVRNLTIDGLYVFGQEGANIGNSGAEPYGSTDQIDNVLLSHFEIDCNNAANTSGLGIGQNIASTGPSGPVYSYQNYPVWNVIIQHGTVKNCPNYGLGVQAQNATVDDVHTINSGITSPTGGMLFNSYLSTLTNSTFDWVGFYGVDAGGCVNCTIKGNIIGQLTLEAATASGTGLNVGGGTNTIAADNNITGNGDLIFADRYEADGNSVGFPFSGGNLRLTDNLLDCVSSSCTGIHLGDGMGAYLGGNDVEGPTTSPYILNSSDLIFGGTNSFNGSGNSIDVVPSASTVVTPDDSRTIFLTGTTTVNKILSQTQSLYVSGVSYITVTNKGTTPYTGGAPSVSITGGTCSPAPAAISFIDGNGYVSGVRVTNKGTCTVAPTGVTFTPISGGAGAAATLQFGLPNLVGGRTITVLPGSNLTITNGASGTGAIFNRSGTSLSAGGGLAYQYVNSFGNWVQPQ